MWRRVRRAVNVPTAERDIFDRYGEMVVSSVLAGTFTVRSADLQPLYHDQLVMNHARDWLTERSDLANNHEFWGRTIEILIVVLILAEIGLSIYGIHDARRIATDSEKSTDEEIKVMKGVEGSLESVQKGIAASTALLDQQLSLSQGMAEPSIEVHLPDPFEKQDIDELTIKNTGTQPLKNVSVNLRCFDFRSNYDFNPMMQFVGGISVGGVFRSWWLVSEIRPGVTVKRNILEETTNFVSNADRTFQSAGGKIPLPAVQGTPLPLQAPHLVAFDISYHREADNREYQISRTAWLAKDATTGKVFLTGPPAGIEFQVVLSREP